MTFQGKTQTARVAPVVANSVMVAPNQYVSLAAVNHPLTTVQPTTQLGQVALNLALSTTTSMISVAAISSYVYALTQASAPQITFQAPPPGTTISVQSLQASYDQFLTQLATFQGQAAAWITTQPGTQTTSIFSQLVSVPALFTALNGSVQGLFTVLQNNKPGSPAYIAAMNQLTADIGADKPAITSLVGQMSTLGTNLENAADTLGSAASTGVLYQLQQAYANEIAALNTDINNANATISSDNSKIVGLGFAAAGAIIVGLIGLVNFWNPLGWIMMAAGGVGAYFAITEIESLKAQIAALKGQIDADELWKTSDSQAAASVATFANQVSGFGTMNTAAQLELTSLETLYSTLADDITAALQDLSNNDITDAITEWNTIVQAAAFLANVSAYVWPSPIMLTNPTSLSAAGNSLYAVTCSGQVCQYNVGGNTWTELPGMSLSVVAAGNLVVGINGAPVDGSTPSPTPYTSDYLVKTFAAGTWSTISTTPMALVATDGTTIYGIAQAQTDRQAYQYSGSGSVWTKLAAMPNTDAPDQLAVANSVLYAITTNSNQLYSLTSGAWTAIGTATYSSMTANGGFIALIDTNGAGWQLAASTGTMTETMSGLSALAQAPNGDQYAVDGSLNLYHIAVLNGGAASTLLKANAVGVTVSDTGQVYYADNLGNTYLLSSLANNTWTQLPAQANS